MNIEEELKKVKAALSSKENRQQFLAEWFSSEPGRIIGQDPTRRGNFSREAGMTSEELRLWGNAKFPGPARS